MPELPEVETTTRLLRPHLLGRAVGRPVIFRNSVVEGTALPPATAQGRRIEAVERRAKFIRLRLSGGLSLLIHLRMTGRLCLRTLPYVPEPYARAALPLSAVKQRKREALVFLDTRAFGRWHWVDDAQLDDWPEWRKLGPEPLALAAEDFSKRLRSKNRALKPLLLDQTFLAGLGNIYTDETLFAAGLHPLTTASRVSDAEAKTLFREIRRILRAAIKVGGTTVSDFRRPDGTEGLFRFQLRAYGRAGEPCGMCKASIERIVVGGRGTWFCPSCQKRKRAKRILGKSQVRKQEGLTGTTTNADR
jgi:formamidopyrimidine-DNA glycosylase